MTLGQTCNAICVGLKFDHKLFDTPHSAGSPQFPSRCVLSDLSYSPLIIEYRGSDHVQLQTRQSKASVDSGAVVLTSTLLDYSCFEKTKGA